MRKDKPVVTYNRNLDFYASFMAIISTFKYYSNSKINNNSTYIRK